MSVMVKVPEDVWRGKFPRSVEKEVIADFLADMEARGWKMALAEATPEMLGVLDGRSYERLACAGNDWRAMIAASPKLEV